MEDQEFLKPTMKKTKMSKCEYIKKVVDSSKGDQERNVILTNRSSLALFDQKITVNLDTNKIVVEDDPNSYHCEIPSREDMKLEEVDITQQIIQVPVEILNKATPKRSPIINKESLFVSAETQANIIQMKPTATPNVDMKDMNKIESAIQEIQSSFNDLEKFCIEPIEPLKKCLIPSFQLADRASAKINNIVLPSDNKEVNQELEELMSDIMNYQEAPHEETDPLKRTTIDEENESGEKSNTSFYTVQTTNNLSAQVHNILFPEEKKSVESELKESIPPKETEKTPEQPKLQPKAQESEAESFYTMKEPEPIMEDFDFEEEGYPLSDYSDDENPSYKFQEKFESEEKQKPKKMFELYGKYQLNKADENSNSLNFSQSVRNENSNPFSDKNADSNSNNTMYQDYKYYCNKQEEKNANTFKGGFFEGWNPKVEESPKKAIKKVKRLYCNEKKVPLWATNLDEVEKISKSQKSVFDPTVVFGSFAVENLNLVEVFNYKSRRFLKPRGSSANWRQEATPPSYQKIMMSNEKSSHKKQGMSSTKKALDFKSIKKENYLRY